MKRCNLPGHVAFRDPATGRWRACITCADERREAERRQRYLAVHPRSRREGSRS